MRGGGRGGVVEEEVDEEGWIQTTFSPVTEGPESQWRLSVEEGEEPIIANPPCPAYSVAVPRPQSPCLSLPQVNHKNQPECGMPTSM